MGTSHGKWIFPPATALALGPKIVPNFFPFLKLFEFPTGYSPTCHKLGARWYLCTYMPGFLKVICKIRFLNLRRELSNALLRRELSHEVLGA